MAKVTFTIEDDAVGNSAKVSVVFDPPITADTAEDATPAQTLAIVMIEAAKHSGDVEDEEAL